VNQRLRIIMEHPRAPLAIGGLALLLCAPSLAVGLVADDYIHGLVLRGSGALPAYAHGWTRLFDFASPAQNPALFADGVLAWWSDPQFKLSFFRPLSALTHALDYALWPDAPWLMHAHNLLYFALALGAVYALYARVLTPGWAAALALALYAFDNNRAVAIAWIANRNALLACALSSYAVVLHLRAQDGARRARWASPLCFGAGLLAGEGALGAAAYLIAAECFLARDAPRARVLRLLPSALVALACLGTARALGHGVAHSGEYLDPLRDGGAFVSALPGRALALLGSQLGFFAAEWWNAYDLLLPGLRGVFVIVTLGCLAFWALLFAPLLRARAEARFFAAGALLALLPAAATFPNGRVLGWVSIGLMGLTAQFVASGPLRGVARFGAGLALLQHLWLAPLTLPGSCWMVQQVGQLLERSQASLPLTAALAERRVVFLNPPQDPSVLFIPAMRALRAEPRPRWQRWLATGMSALSIARPGPNTLEIEPTDGFVREQTERVVRARPFALAQRIELPGLRVEVLSLTRDGRPKRARFEFERALEDPSYLWLIWREQGFEPFQPPQLGAAISLPRTDFASMVLGAQHPLARALSAIRRP
jgi:hypothetical protein